MILETVQIETYFYKEIIQMFLDVFECPVDLQTGLICLDNIEFRVLKVASKEEANSKLYLKFIVEDKIIEDIGKKFELFLIRRKIKDGRFEMMYKASSILIIDPDLRKWNFVGRSDVGLL